MSVTLSSLPGKFKCSLLNVFFCPDGITPNSGLTGLNNTLYIYISQEKSKHAVTCSMLHVMGHNKNLSGSVFKAYEPIINEWLSEINKLKMKIVDLSCKVLDSKESGLKQDEIEEGIL